ncbi:hypothetical protein ONE63_007595 [Megalurothrips usitatus]|uniref:Peptidase S1 domain-containing protein n=1 Tax=Megalurothrips usitatus TaxID=439358 RepID=A0AAV7XN77_9NEOP|nr:hypothetical protein ONE63_007595 [Megalurothrips usitatus]
MSACFALLVLGLALAAAASVQVDDGFGMDNALEYASPDELDTRMVGGEVVTEATAYNFMVAIQPRYMLNGVSTRAPVCSGVLIKGRQRDAAAAWVDKYYVLTSAHCALSGTSFELFAGVKKITTQTADDTVTDLTTIAVNDEYRTSQLTGDLALIPTAIVESESPKRAPAGITAAVLANVNDAAKSFLVNTVTMAGWGQPNDVFNGPSPSLRQLSSWVVPNWYCAVRHIGLPIKSTHMCTAGLPNKGPCAGDSGAPLVAVPVATKTGGPRVVGIATLTPNSGCSRGRPGVFTRLGDYLAWIQEVTNYDPEQQA